MARFRQNRRQYRFPIKRALCSTALFIIGVVFSILGLMQGLLAFGIVGLLAITPGSYQGFVLLQTWRGVRGYRLEEYYEEVVTEEATEHRSEEDVVQHDSVPGYLIGGGVSEADVEHVSVELTPVRPQPGAAAPYDNRSVSSATSVDGSVLDEDAAAEAAASEA